MNFFPIERNRYFYGKLLTVHEFEMEQKYEIQKRCLLNRILQGAGVVCGLGVTVDSESTLSVGSGMALDYEGHEIVVEKPLLRKLQMIDGQETLRDSMDAWLCLRYLEEDAEPVNTVGIGTVDRQSNVIREGFELFLTCETPDYNTLLKTRGGENITVLFQDKDLTLILCAPTCVRSSGTYRITILVVKNAQTPKVKFSLRGTNTFLDVEGQKLNLEYHESDQEKRNAYFVEFSFDVQNISGIRCPIFQDGAELEIELGSRKYKSQTPMDAVVDLVADRQEEREYYRTLDSLEKQTSGAQLPLYLAKLELIHSAGGVFVDSLTNLPFGQVARVTEDGEKETNGGGGLKNLSIRTSVHNLKYWQKPEVNTDYRAKDGVLNFEFGIPVAEQYDYTVSHGVVDITLPGGNRVNTRHYSKEIPHGLGPGAVDIHLSVEFRDKGGDSMLMVGNNEVFAKEKELSPLPVEAAAILYPDRGTMRVGIWLHDDVNSNLIRVHYFANRPTLDSNNMIAHRFVSVSITPELARVERGESLRLKATVTGTEDRSVNWTVKDADGGSVDNNGIYTAPQMQGAYEVEAVSTVDETARASVFVIVE